ncbi:MAG: hypothetical protein QX192_05725 [Methylococcales bacterium]
MSTTQPTTRIYLTVNQFIQTHTAFKAGGVRGLIFNESKNGLKQAGAVVRIGRKVLIDESKFFAWIEAGAK